MKYIIGIDEAGRGPLAGPLAVAALAVPAGFKFKIPGSEMKLKDSKKLSETQRGKWLEFLRKSENVFWRVSFVSPRLVDKINVSNAANLAAGRALKTLLKKMAAAGKNLNSGNVKIFLDGGLRLNVNCLRRRRIRLGRKISPPEADPPRAKNVKCVIKGDEKIPAVSAASIAAKVVRDREMLKLHKKFPEYGFAEHKGYGTKAHYRAIKKFGPSPVHRRSFRLL